MTCALLYLGLVAPGVLVFKVSCRNGKFMKGVGFWGTGFYKTNDGALMFG